MDKCLHHMDRIASIMAEINSAFEAHKDGRKGFETDMVDTKQSEEMRKNKEEMLRKDLEGYFCSSFKVRISTLCYTAKRNAETCYSQTSIGKSTRLACQGSLRLRRQHRI